MNRRPLLVLLAVAVAAIALLLVVIPDTSSVSAFNSVGTTTGTSTRPNPNLTSESETPVGNDSSGVTNPAEEQPGVDLPKLEPGSTPPQFVVVSFDGGVEANTGIFQHYLDLAKDTDSRFSFFVSGVYLLPDNEMKLNYFPPGRPRGTSDIGFGDPAITGLRIDRLSDAWNMGMEIGTHYNGHFCGSGGIGLWNKADWTSEISQFNNFLDNWRAYNPQAADHGPLPFSSAAIKGGRTPCLEGNRPELLQAIKAAGYEYDTSGAGMLQWPSLGPDGLWQIPLQAIELQGAPTKVLSMDYNFLANQNGSRTTASPEKCKEIEDRSYAAYVNALKAVKGGNRAPLILGNHMNTWVCDAYTRALTRFIKDTHDQSPDVKFISTIDLVRWMQAQDPALLAVWLHKPAQPQP